MTEEEAEDSCCEGKLREGDTDLFASLLHIADHCLYKIVKWARNLRDFSNISVREVSIDFDFLRRAFIEDELCS